MKTIYRRRGEIQIEKCAEKIYVSKNKMVGWERLELSTNALKGHCSTD